MAVCPLLALLFGCFGGSAAVQRRIDLDVDGHPRSYFLYVPKSAAEDAPVIVLFHGAGTGGKHKGEKVGEVTGLQDQADRLGFVLVSPSSWDGVWNDGRKARQIPPPEIDDLAFVDAVIEDVVGRVSTDRSRIYAAGMSNGGFFTLRLACQRSDRFAGYVAVIASLPADHGCSPSVPVPLWLTAGTADPLIPWEGGTVATNRGASIPVEDAAALFAAVNGCSGEPAETALDADPADGVAVRRLDWSGCRAPTRLDAMEGMGHHWPGARIENAPAWVGAPTGEYDGGQAYAEWLLALPGRSSRGAP